MRELDRLIALIDGVINEPGWQAVVFTERSYAGDYTFNAGDSTLSIVAQAVSDVDPPSLPYVSDAEISIVATGLADL